MKSNLKPIRGIMKNILIIIGGILFFILISFGGSYLLGVIITNIYFDSEIDFEVNPSIIESMKNKTFIKEVKLVPDQIEGNKTTIKFKECWIEKPTKTKHILLFFPTKQILNRYMICLTLRNNDSYNDSIVVKTFGSYNKSGEVYTFDISESNIPSINYVEDFINEK